MFSSSSPSPFNRKDISIQPWFINLLRTSPCTVSSKRSLQSSTFMSDHVSLLSLHQFDEWLKEVEEEPQVTYSAMSQQHVHTLTINSTGYLGLLFYGKSHETCCIVLYRQIPSFHVHLFILRLPFLYWREHPPSHQHPTHYSLFLYCPLIVGRMNSLTHAPQKASSLGTSVI